MAVNVKFIQMCHLPIQHIGSSKFFIRQNTAVLRLLIGCVSLLFILMSFTFSNLIFEMIFKFDKYEKNCTMINLGSKLITVLAQTGVSPPPKIQMMVFLTCLYSPNPFLRAKCDTRSIYFKAEFNLFEFRVFPLWEWLPNQLFTHSWRGNNWTHTFPKDITAIWNAISLVQDSDSCHRVHFLRSRAPLYCLRVRRHFHIG